MPYPITPSRRVVFRRLLVAALCLQLAGMAYLYRERKSETPVAAKPLPASGLVAAVEEARQVEPARAGSASTMAPEPVVVPTHPHAPVAAAIQRVFPSVTEAVKDWRAFRPERIAVAPVEGMPLTFERTELREEGRYVTWVGRNPQLPGATFVGVATVAGYDAILSLPGVGEFSYHVRGDTVVTKEATFAADNCGNDPVQPPKPAADVMPPTVGELITAVITTPQPWSAPEIAAATEGIAVDLLIAYDAETLNVARQASSDPTGYIDGQYKARVESANQALINSQVTNFRWRYLGAVAAPAYVQTAKAEDDLDAISPGGAIGNWAQTTRSQRGADQLVLVVGGSRDFSGIAYGPKQKAVQPNYGLGVVRWQLSYLTLAHELSHNFGCQHDRANADTTTLNEPKAVADNDGLWCYGQLWDIAFPPPNTAQNKGTGGTIMSYADWRIPYFSNPALTVQTTAGLYSWPNWAPGTQLGTQQIGRPESDPKAANNARVLREQAETVSKFMEEVVPPVITQQPQSTAVVRGALMIVSVTATGGGLTYQWSKDGVEIAGATTAIYSKQATDAEAGVYSVKISNYAGSVTSSGATITITAPVVNPPAPSGGGSSGGGGGGGAPSVWFLALLTLAGAVRWGLHRRDRL